MSCIVSTVLISMLHLQHMLFRNYSETKKQIMLTTQYSTYLYQ